MSRIGKKPINVPSEANVTINGSIITVQGPKGALSREIHPLTSVEKDGECLVVKRADDTRLSRSIHGLFRTLINNMVVGVTKGFTRELLVIGVGYKIEEKENELVFNVGHSHSIEFPLPEGIKARVERQKEIRVILEGYDKELLGLTASRIRSLRPPEPYKGKGIRYADERIIRKAGKTAA
ncbi:MAG: 50S ribosomal protein L6 [Deltaproteobacteria bacterium]|nr:50S ribosomal protein L6 [Deltaproteobacteria bacterium]MBW1718898.1 50S ribosomal protein L6 [Deltaproteobacteria bacterium]MBW1932120.1 50S ribosomal protein L6 [Deltaproteobacteria bacterium]MBW1937634.1 50S ribosomal protein L6 [Deltaproteobacteria bacterium]MBW1963784.1 50S ribosomal protein L6 [Deltaproteobacteria bacterium]